MTGTTVTIISEIVTFILSIAVSAFIGGVRFGQIQGDVKSINERLARIEGMFTLRLRDPSRDDSK